MSISGYFLIGEMVKAIPPYSNANEALMRRAFPNGLMLECRYLNDCGVVETVGEVRKTCS